MRLIKNQRVKEAQAELKVIVAQGEAILARLEVIDKKIEEGRKQQQEHESDGPD